MVEIIKGFEKSYNTLQKYLSVYPIAVILGVSPVWLCETPEF
jgi:hypothetical protein